jgi:hypothetical protein
VGIVAPGRSLEHALGISAPMAYGNFSHRIAIAKFSQGKRRPPLARLLASDQIQPPIFAEAFNQITSLQIQRYFVAFFNSVRLSR